MQSEKIAPFKVIGLSIRTTNKEGQAADDIAALWSRFLSENIMNDIPNKVDHTVYSLYTDYEGDHTEPYTAVLGCKVHSLSSIPEGMIGRSFEGGKYVKITAKGDLTKGLIVEKWFKIWNMNLDRNYTVDFEVFGEKAQDPTNAEVEFFVGLK